VSSSWQENIRRNSKNTLFLYRQWRYIISALKTPFFMKKYSFHGSVMRIIAVFLILCFNYLSLHAQIKVWDKRFGGSEYDDLTHSLATSDGGYMLGGHSSSPISGDKSQAPRGGTDFWIIKLNEKGNRVWDKRYGGKREDMMAMMVEIPDGGFLLGGRSDSPRGGDKSQNAWSRWSDYWVVKIDERGRKLWDRRFGGEEIDILLSMVATPDGGFLLGGSSYSGVTGDKTQPSRGEDDYWVVKIDADGNQLWDKRYGGQGSDLLTEIAPTSDGGYLLAGRSDSKEGGDKSEACRGEFDYWIVKIDADGNKLWDKTYGGEMFDLPTKLLRTPDDGFLIGGQSDSDIGGDVSQPTRSPYFDDMWVVRIDKEGNKLWDSRFGGNHADGLRDIDELPGGNYMLSGWSYSDISGEKSEAPWDWGDFWMVTMDPDGNYLSDKRYGGDLYEAIYNVTPMPEGNFLLAGTSQTDVFGDKTVPTRGAYDFWIIKFNPRPALVFYPIDILIACDPICFIDLDIRSKYFRDVSDFSFRVKLPAGKAIFNKSGHTYNPELQSPVSFILENDSTILVTWKNTNNVKLGKDASLIHTSIQILDNSASLQACIADIQAYNAKGRAVEVTSQCGSINFKNFDGGRIASTGESASREIFAEPSIFPNPGTGIYKLTLPQAGDYQIAVRDARGRTLSKISISTKANHSEEVLDLRELPWGFYLINVTYGDRNSILKAIKR
jgi:hypothetical protein